VASIKQGTNASAGSPVDYASAAGLVRVTQDLISCRKFTLIAFLMHSGFVLAAEAN